MLAVRRPASPRSSTSFTDLNEVMGSSRTPKLNWDRKIMIYTNIHAGNQKVKIHTNEVHVVTSTLQGNGRRCTGWRCEKIVDLFVIDFQIGRAQEKFTVWMLKRRVNFSVRSELILRERTFLMYPNTSRIARGMIPGWSSEPLC